LGSFRFALISTLKNRVFARFSCRIWTVMTRFCLFLAVPAALLATTELENGAWDVLNHGLADGGAARRAEAVTALGSIGPTPKVLKLLEAALSDKESTVRQTAAAVLGEMRARQSIPKLKQALDDESADVSFAAAHSLWLMGDRSAREVFDAVLAGERKTSPGIVRSGINDAKQKLHNPAALAKIGVDQAAGFLGPFSMGVWFAEDYMKDKGAPSRALSAKLLGQDTDPGSLGILEQALDDKNSAVRAAAARALGQRSRYAEVSRLQVLLLDSNEGVRYMAAAAIIRLSSPRQKKGPPAGATPSQPAAK
jgi:HEAT repeat protein